jgi:hypothetical protein
MTIQKCNTPPTPSQEGNKCSHSEIIEESHACSAIPEFCEVKCPVSRADMNGNGIPHQVRDDSVKIQDDNVRRGNKYSNLTNWEVYNSMLLYLKLL